MTGFLERVDRDLVAVYTGDKAMTAKFTETPRLASLRAKLKARQGKAEYKKNCEAIRAEIARLENR